MDLETIIGLACAVVSVAAFLVAIWGARYAEARLGRVGIRDDFISFLARCDRLVFRGLGGPLHP